MIMELEGNTNRNLGKFMFVFDENGHIFSSCFVNEPDIEFYKRLAESIGGTYSVLIISENTSEVKQ